MKGDAKVIDYLNQALRSELTAVSQYWLHYRLQEDWGYGRIAAKSRAESIEEMQHADKLIERIIFLGGIPTCKNSTRCVSGKTCAKRSRRILPPNTTPAPSISRRAAIAKAWRITCPKTSLKS